jgi:preprotein translocase subunit SecD
LFIAAVTLYILAVGNVQGFAFTLGLTTIIDVVVVFLFTKPMLTILARTKFFGDGHRLSGVDPERLGRRRPASPASEPAPAGSTARRTREA